jgi:hypothetical protein
MNNVSELTLKYLERYNCPVFDNYKAVLTEACDIYPPPHGKAWYGNLYRQLARNPEWFANSLITNATEEGNGSREVWQFSQQIENQEFAELVRNHSIDESRHSKMFVALLNIIFPTQIEADLRKQLNELSPDYYEHKHPSIETPSADNIIAEEMMMDEIIQINILEIRALILQLLLRPVLQAYAKPEDLAKVTTMSDLLIYDETKHIEYSAYCISKYMEQGHESWVQEMMINRQNTINEMFLEGVELEKNMGATILKTNASSK